MITIQLNELTAAAVRDYGYEPNEAHLLNLDGCLELMDFTVCLHEITGGGPPYWFAPRPRPEAEPAGVESKTVYEGQDVTHLDLTAF